MRTLVFASALAAACTHALAFHPGLPSHALRSSGTRAGLAPKKTCLSMQVPAELPTNRRAALQKMLGLAAVGAVTTAAPPAHATVALPPAGIAEVRAELAALIKAEPDWGPTLVRLAWHSSGTYDRMSKTGGSGLGTIRFKEELAHGANAGLDKAVQKLEPIKAKHPDVSYADLYALSGVVAIETLGGPKVGFKAGRVDSMDPKDVTPNGRLPDADKGSPMKTATHLREIFGRMGFNDQEIVALAGAHALGRCHADASGYVGPWTPTPTTFNNLYFSLLVNLKWEPNVVNEHAQFKDPSGKLMMLPSDIVLVEDAGFRKYVDIYAKNQKKFFDDFAKAFQKLEELGTSGLYPV